MLHTASVKLTSYYVVCNQFRLAYHRKQQQAQVETNYRAGANTIQIGVKQTELAGPSDRSRALNRAIEVGGMPSAGFSPLEPRAQAHREIIITISLAITAVAGVKSAALQAKHISNCITQPLGGQNFSAYVRKFPNQRITFPRPHTKDTEMALGEMLG